MNHLDLISPYYLDGTIVLITGGTGGIGRACVERLANYGAKVALTYVENVEDPKIIKEKFSDIKFLNLYPLNLCNLESIKGCFQSIIKEYGHIDVLVNNAGVGSATIADWESNPENQDRIMFDINADGTLKMCQNFLALPDKKNKKLINISSVGGGISAFPKFRHSDGMSKAAVAFLTRQLAAEAVHLDVDVFAICPGATNTAMFEASTLSKLTFDEREKFLLNLPKKRLIEPQEIAAIVHFLSCPLSSVLHGSIIDASMGLGVRPGLLSEYKY